MGKNQQSSKGDFFTECPIAYTARAIGGKWKMSIIWQLHTNGVLRYGELKRNVDGITNMMLTQSLQELQQYDIVKRVQYMEVPPKVEYSLTEGGQGLIPALEAMATWGKKHMNNGKNISTIAKDNNS